MQAKGRMRQMGLAVVVAAAALLWTSPAWAVLGESRAELVARYGAPKQEDADGALLFQKEHWAVLVRLSSEGKAALVVYTKTGGQSIFQAEQESLRKINGSGWYGGLEVAGWIVWEDKAGRMCGSDPKGESVTFFVPGWEGARGMPALGKLPF